MTPPRIYAQENNDAYVFIGTWIIRFADGTRQDMVRLVADADSPGAYHGVDGNRYQIGETVILVTHPLTKKRVFFDADKIYNVPDVFVRPINMTKAVVIPRGSPIFGDEGEDYVSDVEMLFVDGAPKLIIKTFCGHDAN